MPFEYTIKNKVNNTIFFDYNGDKLTYSIFGGTDPMPDWLVLNSNNNSFTGTPQDNSPVGKVTFYVKADDGRGGTVNQTMTIDI